MSISIAGLEPSNAGYLEFSARKKKTSQATGDFGKAFRVHVCLAGSRGIGLPSPLKGPSIPPETKSPEAKSTYPQIIAIAEAHGGTCYSSVKIFLPRC